MAVMEFGERPVRSGSGFSAFVSLPTKAQGFGWKKIGLPM